MKTWPQSFRSADPQAPSLCLRAMAARDGPTAIHKLPDARTMNESIIPKIQAPFPRTPADRWPDDSPQRGEANRILREERFRLLVHGVTDYAIFLLDAEGRIICWNTGAEHIFGYTEAEVLDQFFGRFFTPEDISDDAPRKELAAAAEHGSVRDDRFHVRKNGESFYVRGTITAIRRGDDLLGFAKVIHDLKEEQARDELRRQARALIEADRMKDEFLAMLAHELRNPLAPILNAIEILRSDASASPVAQQAKVIVERQAKQMARLIDDLLDVSRITVGKIELRKEQVEIGVLIDRAIETTKSYVDTRHHEVSVTVEDGPLWVEADPARLEQALANLLINAAKFTEQSGRIWITTKKHDGHATVRVRDSGVGITPELLPRIFDLFVQADRSLDRSQGGLGIGLTMVKRIIALHGGRVDVTSDGAGKGSEFSLHVPMPPTAVAGDQVQTVKTDNTGKSRLRVLVIEDNVDSAESLKMILSKAHGHSVMTAHTGPDGLELADSFQPDVVLLDIGLPGMDGFEVANRLRALTGMKSASIIAVTGYSRDLAAIKHPTASLFDHHLTKPVDLDKLEQLLQMMEKP